MARQAEWFEQVEGVLAELQAPGWADEALGRADIERLFRADRRQAQRLLRRFGAATEGDQARIGRAALIFSLEAVRASPDYGAWRRGRDHAQSVAADLARGRQAGGIALPAPPPDLIGHAPALPATVRVVRTRTGYRQTIDAADPVDLLRQGYLVGLFALDTEAWHALVEGAPDEAAQEAAGAEAVGEG